MLGAALLVGSLALGQSAEPPKATEISFREFLEEITTSYPEFAILDAEIEGARALESLAFWTRWSPKVRARGVFGVVPAARGSIFDSPDTPRDLDDLGPFMRANVTASIPLFTFGRLSNAHEAASTLVQANEAKADAKKLAVTELAAKAYFGHLLADESLALIEEVQGRVGDLLDKLRSAEDDDDEEAESDPLDLLKTRSYELKLAQRHVEQPILGRFLLQRSDQQVARVQHVDPEQLQDATESAVLVACPIAVENVVEQQLFHHRRDHPVHLEPGLVNQHPA